MRTIGKIAKWLVGTLIGLYLVAILFFNLDITQRWMGKVVSSALTSTVGSEVTIDKVSIGLFNRVIAQDVRIKDKSDAEMVKAKTLTAKIEWRSLLGDQLILRTISLLDADVCLYKSKPSGEYNFQYILDAFKSDSETKKPLNLRINSIILHRVNVKYDDQLKEKKGESIDPNHLKIDNLSANVSLKSLQDDSLNLRVREVAFKEQSGLDVKHLGFKVEANKHRIHLSDLFLRLPNTEINQKEVDIRLDDNDSLPFIERISTTGTIEPLHVTMSDFGFIQPQLKEWNQSVDISGQYALQKGLWRSNLTARTPDNSLAFQSDNTVSWTDKDHRQVYSKIHELNVLPQFVDKIPDAFVADATKKTIDRLGFLKSSGELWAGSGSGYRFNIEANTQKGQVHTSGTYQNNRLVADVRAENLALNEILDNHNLPSRLDVDSKLNLVHSDGKLQSVQATALVPSMVYNTQHYHNLKVDADWRNRQQSRLDVSSLDDKLDLTTHIEGNLLSGGLRDVKGDFVVNHADLRALNMKLPFELRSFSGSGQVDIAAMQGNRLDGQLSLRDVTLESADTSIYLSNLSVDSRQNSLDIVSDIADLKISGKNSVGRLIAVGKQIVHSALPGLLPAPSVRYDESDNWALRGILRPTSIYERFFHLPLSFSRPIAIEGQLSPYEKSTHLTLFAPNVKYGNVEFNDLRLYVDDADDGLNVLVQGCKELGGKDIHLTVDAKAADNLLNLNAQWQCPDDETVRGSVSTTTGFGQNGQRLDIMVGPSEFSLGESLWHISPSELLYDEGSLLVDGFELQSEGQGLKINGSLSKDKNDAITASLKNLDLEYIMDLVNFNDVDFAGPVSGEARFTRQEDGNRVQADVVATPLYLNGAEMGMLTLKGGFDFETKQIDLDGYISQSDSSQVKSDTHVEGYVNLTRKDLHLDINGTQTNLAFLQKFVGGILDNIAGRGTGHVVLYGPLKKLDLEGVERVTASVDVPVIGTHYDVTDGVVRFTSGKIAFEQFALSDNKQGRGTLNGALLHNHLKNIKFDMTANVNNMFVYNQARTPDMTFYATAYGTGRAHLYGQSGRFDADIDMVTEPGTTFVYLMASPGDASSTPFVHIGEVHKDVDAAEGDSSDYDDPINRYVADFDRGDIRLNMNIEANENAEMRVVMDEKTGDVISTRGLGVMRADFYNKGDFRMYGTYTLSEGSYRLQIQNIISKTFTFKEGSHITFSGNPMEGDMDMQAVYTVNSASLRDLNIGNDLSTSTTKVNCLLNLQGKVQNPDVSFDIEFPNINSDEADLFKSVISTKEDLQRQVAYLLAVGRFYAQDAEQIGQGYKESQASAATKSLLSNMLSGQINNALQSIIGQSNWTIGTNLATGSLGTRSMEAEALISGRLFNNRLLIDGNIGYRDNTYNTSNFVGDFDVQYLLTPRGEIRLKAYSKTNDRYFTKSSLTTQGVGIAFNRNFSRFKELFKRRSKKKK